jgi:hypothetical protein
MLSHAPQYGLGRPLGDPRSVAPLAQGQQPAEPQLMPYRSRP